ncbi:MAG: hypothetical protein AMXMBFR47_42140 [Planctomycetota bacterium]
MMRSLMIGCAAVLFLSAGGCLYDPDVGVRGFYGVSEWLNVDSSVPLTEESVRALVLERYPLGTDISIVESDLPAGLDSYNAGRCDVSPDCELFIVRDSRSALPCSRTSFIFVNFTLDDMGQITDVAVFLTGVCL